ANDYPVIAFGLRTGEIFGVPIETQWQAWKNIDTITLYVGPSNQSDLFEKIMLVQPKRVIFNPGTENMLLAEKLSSHSIHVVEACTLVLLTTRQYDIA
ncbi:CoA-binding protein, partial [Arthrospira platensis SPKY2]